MIQFGKGVLSSVTRTAFKRRSIVPYAEGISLRSQQPLRVMYDDKIPLEPWWLQQSPSDVLSLLTPMYRQPNLFPSLMAERLWPSYQRLTQHADTILLGGETYRQVVVHDLMPEARPDGHLFFVLSETPVPFPTLISKEEGSGHDAIASGKLTMKQALRLVSRLFPGGGYQCDVDALGILRPLTQGPFNALYEGVQSCRSLPGLGRFNLSQLVGNESLAGMWILGHSSMVMVADLPLIELEGGGFLKCDLALTTPFHVLDGAALRGILVHGGKVRWISLHVGVHHDPLLDWLNLVVAAKAFALAFHQSCHTVSRWETMVQGLGQIEVSPELDRRLMAAEALDGVLARPAHYREGVWSDLLADSGELSGFDRRLGWIAAEGRYPGRGKTMLWPDSFRK